MPYSPGEGHKEREAQHDMGGQKGVGGWREGQEALSKQEKGQEALSKQEKGQEALTVEAAIKQVCHELHHDALIVLSREVCILANNLDVGVCMGVCVCVSVCVCVRAYSPTTCVCVCVLSPYECAFALFQYHISSMSL